MALPFVTSMNNTRGKDNRPHRFAYDYGTIDPGMFTPGATRNIPRRAPKRSLAYTIPLPPPAADSDKDRSQGHVLGVNSLALSFTSSNTDTTAMTGGLLFSGGRDGVVKAWDLNIPVRQQGEKEASSAWAIDRRKVRHSNSTTHTTLRESQIMHSDWVNDIVVVGDGSTVISASSDQTVRSWSPFNTDQQPCTIGAHLDYVKALAYSPHRQMVISGGLDRKIKLWDVGQAPQPTTRGLKDRPMAALQEFGDASSSLSIYALSCNTQGSLVVSGSPENFIRLWDTRMARQLTTLTGHTDHVRAVLLSPDSELVLSGSSDSTVKLWSMRMRRCLSTFTHHSDSVWSLHSTHPRFQTFYSGSRDGLIAKTIGAGMFADELPSNRRGSNATTAQPTGMSRSSTGGDNSNNHRNPTVSATANVVCVAIAKESQGVVKLMAADDTYIWTATKGTKLNRWLDVTVRPSQYHSVANSKSMALRYGSFGEDRTSSSSSKASSGYSQRDSSEIVTRKSLIVPWQDFTLGISGLNGIGIGGNSDTADDLSNREAHSSPTRHRRNRTIDYSSVPSTCNEKVLQQSPHLLNNNPAVSPVLKAMQEEKAQLRAIYEDEDEDEDGDESVEHHQQQQPQPETTPLSQHRRSYSHTQSAGGGGHPWTASPITTILAANNTSTIAEDPDTLSIPDSPLPAACLIKSGNSGSKDPSPSVVESVRTRQNHSQHHHHHQRQTNGESAFKHIPSTFGQNVDLLVGEIVPVREKPEESIYGRHGLHRFRVLDNRRQVLAQDTRSRVSLWDIMLCRRIYEFPESENNSKDTMFPGICGTDFDDIFMSINPNPESVNAWCHVDTRIGSLTVHLEESWVWNAEVHVDEVDEVADEVIRAMGEHERVNIGQWMLKRLFLSYARTRVKRGTVSAQNAFLLNCWAAQIPAAAVLPAGQQGASSQQQKQQQVRSELSIPNSSSCTNLALAASAAVAAAAVGSSGSGGSETVASANAADAGSSSNGNRSSNEVSPQPLSAPAISRSTSVQGIVRLPTLGTIPKATGLTPPNSAGKQETSSGSDIHRPMTMCIATQLAGTAGEIGLGDQGTSITATLSSLDIGEDAYGNDSSVSLSKRKTSHSSRLETGSRNSPRHHHKASIDTAPSTTALASATQKLPPIPANPSSRSSSGGSSSKGENKEDGGEGGASEPANNANSGSSGSTSGKFINRLLSMRVRRQKSTPTTSQTPGTDKNGLNVPMLPNSNKSTSTPGGVVTNSAAGSSASSGIASKPSPPAKDQFAEWAGQRYPTDTERTLALLRNEPASWEQLYSPIICPRLPLPRNVVVQMYQECFGASEPYVIYRNTVEGMTKALDSESSANSFSILRVTDDPLLSFELCMPAWLTDFLLYNRLPASYQEPVKISFILSPASQSILPPFPNPNARLVANRMLRARKLAVYVVDKLGLPLMHQPAPNYVNAVEACVRSYQKKGGEERDLEITTNMYIDMFTKAGEELSDMEKEALRDMASWMEARHRRAQSGGGRQMSFPATTKPADNDSDDSEGDSGEDNHVDDRYRGKPELYLDLFCKNKQVSSKQTLATIKTSAWKSSSDVQIHYDWASFVKQRISQAQTLAQQQQEQQEQQSK